MPEKDSGIARGYFGMGFEPPIAVSVKSDKDFLLHLGQKLPGPGGIHTDIYPAKPVYR